MNLKASTVVAFWLALWGLFGCTALVAAGILLFAPGMSYRLFGVFLSNPRSFFVPAFLLGLPAAPCLREAVLFWQRKAFSGFGQAVVLVNVLFWSLALALVTLGTPINLSSCSNRIIDNNT